MADKIKVSEVKSNPTILDDKLKSIIIEVGLAIKKQIYYERQLLELVQNELYKKEIHLMDQEVWSILKSDVLEEPAIVESKVINDTIISK